jgi:hypothetical protein
MRKFAHIAALALLSVDAPEGGGGPGAGLPAGQMTGAELATAPVQAGANDVDAQLRIELENSRQQVRLLTKENQDLRSENERLGAIVAALPAKHTGRLAELIAEKRRAGLNEADAIECAQRQMAHDEAEAAKAKKK